MKRSGPERSKASSLVTCSQPSPSLPMRQLSGMNVSLKLTSFQSWRPARLVIGHPMGAGGRAVAQKLFGDDVAVQEAPLAAAILPGPGDADPALLAHRLAEFRRARIPAREAVLGLDPRQCLLEEGADFHAQ